MKILVIFTCFNRKLKTENCIKSLTSRNQKIDFEFIIVDDASSDGTKETLQELKGSYNIHLIEGSGDLFYSGGMRRGMIYALENLEKHYDYLFICNDDVEFGDASIEKMVKQSTEQNQSVIVGATKDSGEAISYGAIKYTKGTKYRKLSLDEWKLSADTFNANAVLIPYTTFMNIGAIDSHYVHSLGDFDYGLSIKRAGYSIYSSKEYVGLCESNSNAGEWTDISLPRYKRIIKKESAKGAPTRQWFYFLNKNFGFYPAIKGSVTPYLRILVQK